jgi:hypothetical protein
VGLAATIFSGCGPDDDGQRLEATGELVGADGATRANVVVDHYEIDFFLANDVTIQRAFFEDATPKRDGIRSDADGRFLVTSADLNLSYEWDEDVYVCSTVCVAYAESCYDVTEEVCEDTCSYEECWDECTTECWDETVCETFYDEFGNPYEECWTEEVCQDDCYEVCDTVSEPCNCHLETYEQCDQVCAETAEECDWVTYTHTAFPSLSEVVGAQATVAVFGDDGLVRIVGEPIESSRKQECDDGDCEWLNTWVQHDVFVLP